MACLAPAEFVPSGLRLGGSSFVGATLQATRCKTARMRGIAARRPQTKRKPTAPSGP